MIEFGCLVGMFELICVSLVVYRMSTLGLLT
jgi:hypothetical protein